MCKACCEFCYVMHMAIAAEPGPAWPILPGPQCEAGLWAELRIRTLNLQRMCCCHAVSTAQLRTAAQCTAACRLAALFCLHKMSISMGAALHHVRCRVQRHSNKGSSCEPAFVQHEFMYSCLTAELHQADLTLQVGTGAAADHVLRCPHTGPWAI